MKAQLEDIKISFDQNKNQETTFKMFYSIYQCFLSYTCRPLFVGDRIMFKAYSVAWHGLYFFRHKAEEKQILDELGKCSQSVQKSSDEQAATMRAWSVANNLDVDKVP